MAGWDVTITEVDGSKRTYHIQSDWTKEDADGDELDDWQESLFGLDPNKADTDVDGLLDGYDVTVAADDPRVATWDELGILWLEADQGQRRYLGEWDHESEPLQVDTDLDGLPDGVEVGARDVDVCGRSVRVSTDPRQEDTDNDFLLDADEIAIYHSDPTRKDTDGDGADDLVDVDPCSDVHLGYATFELQPADAAAGPFWVETYWPNEAFPQSIGPIEADNGTVDFGATATAFDVDDGVGNLRDGRQNVTVQFFVYSGEGNDRSILDVASETGGGSQARLSFDVRDGSQAALDEDEQPVDGSDGTYLGDGGSLTVRLERADPSP